MMILLFGILSFGLAAQGPSPESRESSYRARLIDGAGESLAVRVDLKGPSSAEDILSLFRHWSLGDIEGFMATFRNMRSGSLQFVGGSGASILLHASVVASSESGERILLAGEGRRDLLPRTRKRVTRNYRFFAIVLDVDAAGRGEGLLYENADLDFGREKIVLRSFVSTPKRLINIVPAK